MILVKDLFNFRGRGSRKEWWLTHAGLLLGVLILFGLLNLFGLSIRVPDPKSLSDGARAFLFYGLLLLIGLLSTLVTIRRLHDAGYSAWWCLAQFVPYIGGVCILMLVCFEGEAEANKYGAPIR